MPIALGKLFEPDAYNLMLLLPSRTGLQAYGSTSGVLSRGFSIKEKIQLIDKRLVLQDVPPQPRPDLVPTCLWYSQQVVAPNFLTFYFVNSGVKNQGTVAAGASQARYANSTLSVPILQPGQVHTLVFSFTKSPHRIHPYLSILRAKSWKVMSRTMWGNNGANGRTPEGVRTEGALFNFFGTQDRWLQKSDSVSARREHSPSFT